LSNVPTTAGDPGSAAAWQSHPRITRFGRRDRCGDSVDTTCV